jgi:hypothetical protein
MSRTGVEEKPAWRSVPLAVRRRVADALGAPVARAARVWGGYGPSPTYRLRLGDGRRAFLKATWPGSNEFQRKAHERELRAYREIGGMISPWAPEFLGELDEGEWRVMLLEDLGPKSAPPWTPSLVRRVAHGLAEFHASTLGSDLPEWLRGTWRHLVTRTMWREPAPQSSFDSLAGAAGERAGEARLWLREFSPALTGSAKRLLTLEDSLSLIHIDVRSDNLRVVNGALRLFDWPHAGVGAPEFDAAAWAQTVEIEGGPDAETVMRMYGERIAVREDVLTSAVASISGYFANMSWQPAIPGLPRVRDFQRAQLRVTLRWAARRLGLPEPEWVDGVRGVSLRGAEAKPDSLP